MPRIIWDADTERFYETGVDCGVLYKKIKSGANAGQYGVGVGWNGLTGVTESPSGAEETALYANNNKYLSLYSAEELGGTIKAYTYPDEWAECDGSASVMPGLNVAQQPRTSFGLAYRTVLGNDAAGEDYGHKIHLIYGATASPSEKAYETINDSPEAIEFSWEFKTVPVYAGTTLKKTSLITIETPKFTPESIAELEDILYGDEEHDPRLPMPTEVFQILQPVSSNGATGSETGATGATGATGDTGATGEGGGN